MKSNNIFFSAIILMLLTLSACSSMDRLKFWESDEIDLDEPAKLLSISEDKTIELLWSKSFDGINDLGNFQPAFNSQDIFFASSDGTVISMDIANGNENWKTELNFLASGVASGFGIVVISDIDGNVIALDQENGFELWKTNVKGEVLSSVAIDPRAVVVKTGSGELFGLDKDNGLNKWSYRSKLPSLTIRGSSSPIIVDDKVYVTFDSGRLGVFQIESGFPIWDGAISYVTGSSELENLIDSDANPVIEGGLVFTTNYQGNLNIFDLAQKRSIWSSPMSSFFSPLITRGMIIVVASSSEIKTFSSKTLIESWSSSEYLNRSLSNPVSFKGNVVVGDFEGFVHVINPINGITIGRKKISRKPIKTIIGRSNNLFVIDEAFNLYSLKI